MVKRRGMHPEGIEALVVVKLFVRLEGRRRHPVEREQQDEQEDAERKIERDQPARQALEIVHAFGGVAASGHRQSREPCCQRRRCNPK